MVELVRETKEQYQHWQKLIEALQEPAELSLFPGNKIPTIIKPSAERESRSNSTKKTPSKANKSIFSSQLWSLIPLEKRNEYLANKDGDTAPVLNLLPLGYSKVLGKGRLPEIPIVVRARYFSREAERKIKEAGGIVELVA